MNLIKIVFSITLLSNLNSFAMHPDSTPITTKTDDAFLKKLHPLCTAIAMLPSSEGLQRVDWAISDLNQIEFGENEKNNPLNLFLDAYFSRSETFFTFKVLLYNVISLLFISGHFMQHILDLMANDDPKSAVFRSINAAQNSESFERLHKEEFKAKSILHIISGAGLIFFNAIKLTENNTRRNKDRLQTKSKIANTITDLFNAFKAIPSELQNEWGITLDPDPKVYIKNAAEKIINPTSSEPTAA
jgi:hypothetical protein